MKVKLYFIDPSYRQNQLAHFDPDNKSILINDTISLYNSLEEVIKERNRSPIHSFCPIYSVEIDEVLLKREMPGVFSLIVPKQYTYNIVDTSQYYRGVDPARNFVAAASAISVLIAPHATQFRSTTQSSLEELYSYIKYKPLSPKPAISPTLNRDKAEHYLDFLRTQQNALANLNLVIDQGAQLLKSVKDIHAKLLSFDTSQANEFITLLKATIMQLNDSDTMSQNIYSALNPWISSHINKLEFRLNPPQQNHIRIK